MIEFDDAGIGCPILGEVFVARRVESDEVIECYLEYEHNHAQNVLRELLLMLQKLNPRKDEIISLCRGDVFNAFDNELQKAGYQTKRVKIEGKTNDIAEERFYQELLNVGMPKSIKMKKRRYGRFYYKVMVWYDTFYEGKSLLKRTKKLKEIDYVMNRVSDYPHLMAKLFNIKTASKEKRKVMN